MFDQRRDEGVARAPVESPEWTDLNSSDPGITLLQLSAAVLAAIVVFTALRRWIRRRRPVERIS